MYLFFLFHITSTLYQVSILIFSYIYIKHQASALAYFQQNPQEPSLYSTMWLQLESLLWRLESIIHVLLSNKNPFT